MKIAALSCWDVRGKDDANSVFEIYTWNYLSGPNSSSMNGCNTYTFGMEFLFIGRTLRDEYWIAVQNSASAQAGDGFASRGPMISKLRH